VVDDDAAAWLLRHDHGYAVVHLSLVDVFLQLRAVTRILEELAPAAIGR